MGWELHRLAGESGKRGASAQAEEWDVLVAVGPPPSYG